MPEPSVTARMRQAVMERAHGRCEYGRSQAQFATQPFSVEPIQPHSRGGPTEPANLALACQVGWDTAEATTTTIPAWTHRTR